MSAYDQANRQPAAFQAIVGLSCFCLTFVSIPLGGQCGESRRVRLVEESANRIVRLQNDDGSWGVFRSAAPDVDQHLRLETTGVASLALVLASDDRMVASTTAALSRGRGFMFPACRSLEGKANLTEGEERLLAIATLALLESQEGGKRDQEEFDEVTQYLRKLQQLLLHHITMNARIPAMGWHCIVLDSAARKEWPLAIASLDDVKMRFAGVSRSYSAEEPWQLVVRSLLMDNRKVLIREMQTTQEREGWVASFDNAVFCSVAYDRISCFYEVRDAAHRGPLIRVSSEGGKPLYDRPIWMKWHNKILERALHRQEPLMDSEARPEPLVGWERVEDARRGVSPEWRDIRVQIMKCFLCELYFRRMLINAPPEQ